MARGERARISRELHDVVAHHISMIAVQAETARVTTQGLPAPAAQRLLAIGDTARTALTEMRRLLGVLREDVEDAPAQNGPGLLERGLPSPGLLGPGQQSPGGRRASRQPQPGLGQLNELIDETRAAAGTGARLIVRGPVAPLDPGVELAAYRIVQEALTNARRHAPGAAVDVELNYTGTELQLLIRDNGPGPPQAADGGRPMAHSAELEGGGHGLPGMRERALAVGGKLSAGAAAGGGFLVEARLSAKTEDA